MFCPYLTGREASAGSASFLTDGSARAVFFGVAFCPADRIGAVHAATQADGGTAARFSPELFGQSIGVVEIFGSGNKTDPL